MLHNFHRNFRNLHLLELAWWQVHRANHPATVRAALHFVIHHPVDLCGSERLALVALVALLAPTDRLSPGGKGGGDGLTISLEGGLEESDEFLDNRATWASRSATCWVSVNGDYNEEANCCSLF